MACVVFVHYCHHCLPCPEGIEQIREWYGGFPVKASACVECGVCLERCPFGVEITAKMREAAAIFERQTA